MPISNQAKYLPLGKDFGPKSKVKLVVGKKSMKTKKKSKKQGYNDRMDEMLGAKHGKKSQSLKSRRDESAGMEKKLGRKKYAGVKSMDKGSRKRKAK